MPFQETAGPLEATVSFAKRHSFCYSFLFLSGIVFFAKAPVGTICGIGLSRARSPIYLCSLEPKTAWYFCFRVTDLFDAGIVVFNKLIICFYTTLTVCVSQVFGAIA